MLKYFIVLSTLVSIAGFAQQANNGSSFDLATEYARRSQIGSQNLQLDKERTRNGVVINFMGQKGLSVSGEMKNNLKSGFSKGAEWEILFSTSNGLVCSTNIYENPSNPQDLAIYAATCFNANGGTFVYRNE